MGPVARRSVTVGGQAISLLESGPADGPLVVLVHGMASDNSTWAPALAELADRGLRTVAPDLLGHGESAKPGTGYQLPDFAAGLAGLVAALGRPSAVLGGHSFGGAVALQAAFQYPGLAEKLIVIAAGGLGKQVHPILRAAAVPGAGVVVRAAASPATARTLRRLGVTRRIPPDARMNLRRAGRALNDPDGRAAFLATLRGVISVRGQRGSLIEMRRIAAHTPTLLVWSEGDRVIPVTHAYALQRELSAARLELFPGTSHEPHRRFAPRFADAVADFVGPGVGPA